MKHTAAAPIKILFYAINGTGLGHLSRLLAMARTARDLVQALGHRAEFQFLTTSEAPEITWDFPVYKLPSKTVVADSGSSPRPSAANPKLRISNLVAGFRPDVLVLDTIPEGSYREFLFLRDYAKRCAFVDRHKKRAWSESDTHLSHLSLYDLVLVPDHESAKARYPTSRAVTDRRRFIGPVHGFDARRAQTRTEVREQFDAAPDERLVYVSAGGGGDAKATQDLETILEVLSEDPKNRTIVGYGPLYRGRKMYRSRVIPYADANASAIFPGIDLAISAAGYNTYQELLAARVPTIFFAQEKGMDRQDERVLSGLESGWHGSINAVEPNLLRAEIDRITRPEELVAMRDALETRPQAEGALRGAVELLRLHSSIDRSPLDSRSIVSAALARQSWEGVPGETEFVDCFRNAALWDELTRSDLSRLLAADEDVAAWHAKTPPPPESARSLERGVQLAHFQRSIEMRDGEWRAFLKDFLADAPARGPDVVESLLRILDVCLTEVVRAHPGDAGAEFLRESRDRHRAIDLASSLQEWAAEREESPGHDNSRNGQHGVVGHANEE